MSRARGANARVILGFEATPGVHADGDCFQMPVAEQISLGESQGLIASDLIGRGSEPEAPSDDAVNNGGNVMVPVDLRYFGIWLTTIFGEPTSTQGRAAKGSIAFANQPVNNATITVGGQAITFVTGTPTANQVKIGADLAATLEALAIHLNASEVTAVKAASYSVDLARTKLEIVHDTIGTAGNSFALAASTSPVSNATVSAASLSGGSATGPWNHVWESGADTLPTASVELGFPEVPSFGLNTYVMAQGFQIDLRRGGHLNARIDLYAQAEHKDRETHWSATPGDFVIERFSQFSGDIRVQGVPLGYLTGGQVSYGNGLDIDESIRADGRTGGADPADRTVGIRANVRYADTRLEDLAEGRQGVEMSTAWSLGPDKSLTIAALAVRLPKVAAAVRGKGGIQKDYEGIGHRAGAAGKSMRVTLVNDVPSYAVD